MSYLHASMKLSDILKDFMFFYAQDYSDTHFTTLC